MSRRRCPMWSGQFGCCDHRALSLSGVTRWYCDLCGRPLQPWFLSDPEDPAADVDGDCLDCQRAAAVHFNTEQVFAGLPFTRVAAS